MPLFALIPLVSFCINAFWAVWVFLQDPKAAQNRTLALWGAGLAGWNGGAFLMFMVESRSLALIVAHFTLSAVLILPPIYFDLCLRVTNRSWPRYRAAMYLAAGLLFLTNFGPWLVADVRRLGDAWFSTAGPAFFLYTSVLYPMAMVPAFYVLGKGLRQCRPVERQRRIRFLITNLILAIGGTHDLIPVFGFDTYPGTAITIYPWGILGSSFYGLLVAYAVLDARLVELRISVGHSVATSIRATYLTSFVLLAFALAAMVWPALMPRNVLGAIGVLIGGTLLATALFPRLLSAPADSVERWVAGDRFELPEQVRAVARSLVRLDSEAEIVATVQSVLENRLEIAKWQLVTFTLHGTAVRSRFGTAGAQDTGQVWDLAKEATESVFDLRTDGGVANAGWSYAFRLGDPAPGSGVLLIGDKKAGGTPSRNEVRLLAELALQLAASLDRIFLREHATKTTRDSQLASVSQSLLAANDQLHRSTQKRHELLGVITHELRSPLAVAQILLRKMDAISGSIPEQVALVKQMADCHEHLVNIVNDGLDFARFEMGLVPIRLAKHRLTELLTRICEPFKGRANEKHVTLLTNFEEVCSDIVWCDPLNVRRILINVIDNAVKFTEAGTVSIKAATSVTTAGIHVLKVLVRDTGRGISPERRDELFKHYVRSSEDAMSSSGLGLAITAQLIHLLGGAIRVESAQGVGSSFELEIPFVPTDAGERPFQRSLLVVEDEDVQRQHVTALCEELGAVVTGVSSIAELQALDPRMTFEMAILDFNLEDGTAMDAVPLLLNRNVAMAISVVTAHATAPLKDLCVGVGVHTVLAKPLSLSSAITLLGR